MKPETNLTTAELRLANLIWEKGDLPSPELVNIANEKLNWHKSTTYTVLRKLCQKGIFANKKAQVTILIGPDELAALGSRRFVDEAFNGDLPRFVAAFIGDKKLSAKQIDELKRIIDDHEGADSNG